MQSSQYTLNGLDESLLEFETVEQSSLITSISCSLAIQNFSTE